MPDGAKIILRKHTLYTKNLFTFQSASLRSSGPANLPTARDSRQTRMRLSAAGRTRQCRRRWHKTKRHPPRSWCPCQRPSAFTTDGQGQESAGRAHRTENAKSAGNAHANQFAENAHCALTQHHVGRSSGSSCSHVSRIGSKSRRIVVESSVRVIACLARWLPRPSAGTSAACIHALFVTAALQ